MGSQPVTETAWAGISIKSFTFSAVFSPSWATRAMSSPSGRPAPKTLEKECSPTKAPAATGMKPLSRIRLRSSMRPSS